MGNDNNHFRRIFLKITGTALSVGLAGCTGDDANGDEPADGSTGEDEPTDGSTGEDEPTDESTGEDESTDESTEEPESFPDGLSEDGADLEVLRMAVEVAINDDSFISHSERITELRSTARTIGGDPETDRGKELGVPGLANNQGPIHGVVDEDGVERVNARTENLLNSDGWFFNFYNDGTSYSTSSGGDPETQGAETFQDFVVETASGYADEVFESLTLFDYGSPEWDGDAGLYMLPALMEGDEDVTVDHGGLWVTADGLPVFAGGRISRDDTSTDLFVMLQSEDVEIELPEWIDDLDGTSSTYLLNQ